jgi:RNase P/RNase MRP subunit p29
MIPLIPLLFLLNQPAGPTTLSADIDGDGKPEAISTLYNSSNRMLNVTIGGSTLLTKIQGTEAKPELEVIQIHSDRKQRQVLVTIDDGMDYKEYFFFGFSKGKTTYLGTFGGQNLKATGNGVVYAEDWLGFFQIKQKYGLSSSTGKIVEIPQPFYYCGVEGRVLKSTKLLLEPDKKSNEVAILLPGAKVTLLLMKAKGEKIGDNAWYLVKSEGGLVGWYFVGSSDGYIELPWAG